MFSLVGHFHEKSASQGRAKKRRCVESFCGAARENSMKSFDHPLTSVKLSVLYIGLIISFGTNPFSPCKISS